MSAGIVSQGAVGYARQPELNDLVLQLKGLVLVRALLETRGVSPVELDKHSNAIARIRDELARHAKAQATDLAATR